LAIRVVAGSRVVPGQKRPFGTHARRRPRIIDVRDEQRRNGLNHHVTTSTTEDKGECRKMKDE